MQTGQAVISYLWIFSTNGLPTGKWQMLDEN